MNSVLHTFKVQLIGKDNQPIPSAMIMINKGDHPFQDIATYTDEQGLFYLPNLIIPGNYEIKIIIDGMDSIVVQYYFDKNSKNIHFKI